MKIISKFKDYYDYVAGYDTDPRKVFVRNMQIITHGMDESHPSLLEVQLRKNQYSSANEMLYFIGQIWFCDQNIIYLRDIVENKFYFDYTSIPTETIQKVDEILYKLTKRFKYSHVATLHAYFNHKEGDWKTGLESHERKCLEAKDMNKIHGQPIYFSQYTEERYNEQIINGRLADIRFSEFKSPQDTFTELYNWIPFIEPEMPSDPTDMGRFENKGFDKKISFRNVK